jgi:hypothetical protein|tara:strand:+ start:979 stop:1137 length:159 start_codon:yes stop_codon:yes gene_type:complete
VSANQGEAVQAMIAPCIARWNHHLDELQSAICITESFNDIPAMVTGICHAAG